MVINNMTPVYKVSILVCCLVIWRIWTPSVLASPGAGERFHNETKLEDSGIIIISGLKGKGEVVKMNRVKLPEPDYRGLSVEEAVDLRRSVREFINKPLELKMLSQLLHAAQGITGRFGKHRLRAAPSAGALYPFEIYIVVNQVKNLERGIYHYIPEEHALEAVRLGDFGRDITKVALGQGVMRDCAAVFVLSAVFDRTTVKYEDRGYRYIYMEAGHIGENIHLEAVSLNLGAVPVGAFYDDLLNKLLGIDGKKEGAISLYAVGEK